MICKQIGGIHHLVHRLDDQRTCKVPYETVCAISIFLDADREALPAISR